jgi:hypothetical protein
LVDPSTINFHGDNVLLVLDDSENGVNAFFNTAFPAGPVMEEFRGALAKRLEEAWRPSVPRPTGAPPPCPPVGHLVVRANVTYEAAGGGTLPVTTADLFVVEKGLESQENGWVFAKDLPVGNTAGREGWIPAAAVEAEGHQARVLRSAGASAGGYISVTAGETVVVMHIERAWVYGYKAARRQPELNLRGWFPRAALVPAPKK